MIIIGGTAAALGFGFKNATQDIDTYNRISHLKEAIEKARAETKFYIPVDHVGIVEAPINCEDRFVSYKPKSFEKLEVKIPEAMDLIFMKMIRFEEHDRAAISQIIRAAAVEPAPLFERYIDEMRSVTKDQRTLDSHFLALVADCFGDSEAQKFSKQLGSVRGHNKY